MRKNITDRTLKALKPGDGEVLDTSRPGFGARPAKSGRISFIHVARYPGGSGNPTRRTFGFYSPFASEQAPTFGYYGPGPLSLEQAHKKYDKRIELLARDIDPDGEEERQRRAVIEAERAKQAATCGAALEDYLLRKAAKL